MRDTPASSVKGATFHILCRSCLLLMAAGGVSSSLALLGAVVGMVTEPILSLFLWGRFVAGGAMASLCCHLKQLLFLLCSGAPLNAFR